MYSLDRLDKETSRLHELLKLIQTNKYKADTVWNNFCMEMNKEKCPPSRRYFHKHPKTISNSSSEILSPNITSHIAKFVTRAKSTNTIKFAEPIDDAIEIEEEIDTRCESLGSTDVVTIRDDAMFKKCLKTKCESDKNAKFTKSNSARNIRTKQSVSVVKKKSSRELSGKIRDDVTEKDNFEAKTQGFIEKCMHCMEDIRMQFDVGITPPDGLNDLERRKKRSSEFASRFSRNYLYQLNRQLSDIKKLLHPTLARTSNQNNYIIKQKITSSYQMILQGLQAYLTHLPKSTTVGIPDKIKELLKEIATLCDIHRSYTSIDVNSNVKNSDVLDVFEVRSRCLIDKIDEYYSTASVISLLQQSQSKFSLLESSKARKKSNMKSRYSMYTGIPTRKDVYWKRAIAALARKKYNVQSKYKTAYFKHRPPIEKQTVIKPVIKTKPMERKSSTSIKLKSTIDDDNIKTMIQMEKEKSQRLVAREEGESAAVAVTTSDESMQLIERLVERLEEENKEMTKESIRRMLQATNENNCAGELTGELATTLGQHQRCDLESISQDEQLINQLVDIIKNRGKVKTCHKCDGKTSLNVDDNAGKSVKQNKKERKKSITVTGVKNAQLICIKDEDSISEIVDDTNVTESPMIGSKKSAQSKQQLRNQREQHSSNNDNAHKSTANEESTKNVKSISNGNISIASNTEKTSRIKISRLPKRPLQPLRMLPKKFALNILEYKVNYLKARKGDHMYKKSTIKHPWILMAEISDRILEELLQAIGAEIEVTDVIEGIFASEFV